MKSIKTAIGAKLSATTALTTLLGGSNIYQSNGWQGEVPTTGGAVTFGLVLSLQAPDVPLRTEVYDVSCWAYTASGVDSIAELVRGALHKAALPVTGFAEILLEQESELYETDTRLHRKLMQFRVSAYA